MAIKKNGRPNGGERFGALSARVDVLIESLKEQRAETHARFSEVRYDIGELRTAINNHVATLQARVEAVEKSEVAQTAVDKYKRWLIGTCIVAVGSMLFNLARALLGH